MLHLSGGTEADERHTGEGKAEEVEDTIRR
jgi:hypothetical protein